jgi:hypothetical protein
VLTDIDALIARTGRLSQRLSQGDDGPIVSELFRTFEGFADRGVYNHLPVALLEGVAVIRRRNAADEPRLLRLLVLHALRQTLARLDGGGALPPPLVPVALKTLTLLLRAVDTEADERYRVTEDRYVKDLHLARLRLMPLGAQLLDLYQGFSRKPFLLGAGLAGMPGRVLAMRRLGGHAPWHEFHSHDLAMRFFGAKGWEESLRLCIPLLQRQPEVKGIVGVAWWFDPAVGALTPNMAFPYEVSARFGAQFFPFPRDEDAMRNAIHRSPERAALVASGHYVPRPYLMLLTRAALLARA